MSGHILVVDDELSMCEMLQEGLSQQGFTVKSATNPTAALDLVREHDFDVVLTDVKLGDHDGIALCEQLVKDRPDALVVVMTAFGSMESAVAAIRAGAYDFISKPIQLESLALSMQRAVQHRRLREEVKRLRDSSATATSKAPGMIGESAAMRKIYALIDRIGDTDAAVLITGESGTGKELVAQALHKRSKRPGAFVAVNCAAVPAALLESELFGHMRGAFTDAKLSRKGLFQEADGGTLFLDEIGELPLEMQPKLLRVLQTQKVRPVGGNAEIDVNVRIIAATNRDLEQEISKGTFREDLFYRINVVPIQIPPLRGRGHDVLLLAQHFIERLDKNVVGLAPEAARKLLEYEWPGNVRELENCIECAAILARYDHITLADLPDKISRAQSTQTPMDGEDAQQFLTLDQLERRYIMRVISATGGNKALAARTLGLDRRTLYRKLERYAAEESAAAMQAS
jgi:two-component system response regulator HydG